MPFCVYFINDLISAPKAFHPITIAIIPLTKLTVVTIKLIIFRIGFFFIFVLLSADINPNHFNSSTGKEIISLTPSAKSEKGFLRLLLIFSSASFT